MTDTNDVRLPRWSLTRWLVDPGADVPVEIRVAMVSSLYSTLPIFAGGVLNTLAVSGFIAARIPAWPFIAWAAAELLLALVRVPALLAGRRAIARGERGPSDLYILLGMCWAASVGYGTFISVMSGDWVAASLACLSAAAMVGGICFRNFAAPRLVGSMILLSLGPCAVAGVLSGEPIMLITAFQIPFYLFSMAVAAKRLNRMLVGTMRAELENARRARHDDLTDLLNRAGLAEALSTRSPAEEGLALFYLDLDGFKAVNDNFGHSAGDELLQEVGRRMKALKLPHGLVARIGGDEFVIVAQAEGPGTARRIGGSIIRALGHRAYLLGDEAALIGVSVGVAFFSNDDDALADILREADRALYEAKSEGRCRCVIAEDRRPTASSELEACPASEWQRWLAA